MRIAFYNPTHITFSSGPEIWLCKILPLLARKGFEITLFQTNFSIKKSNTDLLVNLKKNIEIITLKHINLPISTSPIPHLSEFTKSKYSSFDFFYSFNGFAFQDLIGYWTAKEFKAKFIYGIHAPVYTDYFLHNLYQCVISKPIMKRAYKIHTQSNYLLTECKKLNTQTYVLGSGIDKEDIIHETSKNKLLDSVLKIVYLGRLSPQKNIDLLLEVIKRMKNDKTIHFYMAGDGEEKEKVNEIARSCSNLSYLGFIPQTQLNELFGDKHLFINLSRYESFCRTILEAMARGLPVLTTEFDALNNYPEQTPLDRVSQNCSALDIANKIKSFQSIMKNNSEWYLNISNSAIRNAQNYVWEIIADKFIDLFF